ncbi:internal scaffolding protein [Microviridae sp.]|nr:internal scaffolding protein [Microviridae sp.]
MTKKKTNKRQNGLGVCFERVRVATTNDEPSLTKQGFAESCDRNAIIERFTQTGQLPHVNTGAPQYGEAPDMGSFEAACIVAEAASAVEEGVLDHPDPEKASEDASEPQKSSERAETPEPPKEDPPPKPNEGGEDN